MGLKKIEDSGTARIMEIINRQIGSESMPFNRADTQLKDSSGHKPDLVIFDKMNLPFCVVEFKQPYISPYQVEVFDQAFGYANSEGIDWFATCNFNRLVLWKTFEKDVSLKDRRFKEYQLAKITSLEDLDKKNVMDLISKNLKLFLSDLSSLILNKPLEKIIPSLQVDEIFIAYLQSLIESLYLPIYEAVYKEINKNPRFRKKVLSWAAEQMWNFTDVDTLADRASRQYILLLINKIMFYEILRIAYPKIRPDDYQLHGYPESLPNIKIPDSLQDNGSLLNKILEYYFEKVQKVDYKTIYKESFIDQIELPSKTVPFIKILVKEFDKYDFSGVDFEIVGNIFQSLIPETDRHKYGQYFTPSIVVDLILAATVTERNFKILDPSCGAGTFLIRAYSRLKDLKSRGKHRDLLNQLWGVDIAKFPAHLSTLNLVIKDLTEKRNFPRIANDDFFNVFPHTIINQKSPFFIEDLDGKSIEMELPEFNAVITNPPYTRQEEMEEYTPEGYKDNILTLIVNETGIKVGKRSSIYSYFFFHGGQFLAEHGKMGLITSTGWLDADYGKYLQQFFLRDYNVLMIIESKVERFFIDADINTCITILEKKGKKKKGKQTNSNRIVRFVQLRKRLSEVIQNIHGKENFEQWKDNDRWKALDKLVKYILLQDELIVDDNLGVRVFTRSQSELYEDGYNPVNVKYEGSKWGIYIRAPDIFFTLLTKANKKENRMVHLDTMATVRYGIKTGANEFFYLTEDGIDKWKIESRYLKKVFKSPTEMDTILVNSRRLSKKCFVVTKTIKKLNDTNALKYINIGETTPFPAKGGESIPAERPSCKSDPWYDLTKRNNPNTIKNPSEILWVKDAYDKHITYYNKSKNLADNRFYYIYPNNIKDTELIIIFLNSSITMLLAELAGRATLGLGARDIMKYECSKLFVIDPEYVSPQQKKVLLHNFKSIQKRKMGTFFEELGTDDPNNFKLSAVKEDRRNIDEVFFDIVGLNKREREAVYMAIIDLVKNRIEKAQKAAGKKKIKEVSYNIDQVIELVFHDLDKEVIETIQKTDFLKIKGDFIDVTYEKETDAIRDFTGNSYVVIDSKRFPTKTLEQAIFARFYALLKTGKILIPKDDEKTKRYAKLFRSLNKQIVSVIDAVVEDTIPNKRKQKKVRDQLFRMVWESILEYKTLE